MNLLWEARPALGLGPTRNPHDLTRVPEALVEAQRQR